ncbi:hypothetical protein ATO6_04530 [Oceanicola sp. 22II-s10i]|uniref:metallophosphoesterase n=1 Tax=Oceanicola sp. 22II-s10i TaxID=1317116 RepID=UPI000B525E5A|nr:metallophosphoesterase [Oceanicola sp. 22II-s10i]OWU86128.1 hypothetical protein ATO6_04530 [Oceanicola sp. 22II-s10i]
MSIYVIPDIHGQRALLEDALALVERDYGSPDAEIVFLGDYVDRGPDTAGVLEILSRGMAEGRNWTCLMGNHDRMMLNYLTDGTDTDPRMRATARWSHPRLGGVAMQSYGIDPDPDLAPEDLQRAFAAAVPDHHAEFLASLVYAHEREGLLFVHAGIKPGLPVDQQSNDDLIWIRDEFLLDPGPHPWLVIHGHTPVPAARHFGPHIDLDAGAGLGRDLVVAVMEEGECFMITEKGHELLPPQPLAPDEERVWG